MHFVHLYTKISKFAKSVGGGANIEFGRTEASPSQCLATSMDTWFVLVCSISSGRLCNRADERRPGDHCSSLQDVVHSLCSVQRLSGSWWQRHRHLSDDLRTISFRHSSRLVRFQLSSLPHRSLRIRQKYASVIFVFAKPTYFASFRALAESTVP